MAIGENSSKIGKNSENAAESGIQTIRLHGDCHPGNILWTPTDAPHGGPHFVDLDDARSGPAVQDVWMLLSGDRRQRTTQLSALIDGYEQFRPFDRRELALIEPLRTLRLIHYSAWLARLFPSISRGLARVTIGNRKSTPWKSRSRRCRKSR
jgi:Ser/Thr protein kinase RdoA (MazF antagonist)